MAWREILVLQRPSERYHDRGIIYEDRVKETVECEANAYRRPRLIGPGVRKGSVNPSPARRLIMVFAIGKDVSIALMGLLMIDLRFKLGFNLVEGFFDFGCILDVGCKVGNIGSLFRLR